MADHKLLLPVDGSPHSRRAAEKAVEMARMMNIGILLVHCHKPFPALSGEPYYQKAINKILSGADALLAPFRELISDAGIPFEERILEGQPGSKISDVAEIEDCEIIVMGSRGRTELQGLFLGSVTHRVLSASPCPVLVVK